MALPIVIHKHKFVYYPIPKVACTSLKQFCADLVGKKYTNIHLSGFPSQGAGPNYFRFVFVRNPWDRLVSCFLNKMKQNSRSKDSPNDNFVDGIWYGFACYKKKYGFNKNMTFTQFAMAVAKIPDNAAEEHFKSQYIQFPESKNIHVYHFETLIEDFANACKEIGVKYELKHTMRTVDRQQYMHYYTPETQQLIAKRYAADIERFGYKYGC